MTYAVSPQTKALLVKLLELPDVQKCMDFLEADHAQSVKDNLELVVIKAPTFMERNRAERIAEMFRELNLEDVQVDKHNNCFGLKRGTGGGPTLVLEAHIDTVFPMEVPIEPVYRDGKYHAPGIGDNTRSIAFILSLIRMLNSTGIEHCGDIYFLCSAGEEGVGGFYGTRGFFADHPGLIQACVGMDLMPTIPFTFNGMGCKTMGFTFSGTGGHSFLDFGVMANPVHAAGRAIAKISDLKVPEEPKTTYSVSILQAGNDATIHAITDTAVIKVNFRSHGAKELDALEKEIFRCVEDACREETERWGKNTITWSHQYYIDNKVVDQDPHAPIVEFTHEVFEHFNMTPNMDLWGGNDPCVAMEHGIPAVCLGLAGGTGNVHSEEEWYDPTGDFVTPQQAMLISLAVSGIKGKSESIIG